MRTIADNGGQFKMTWFRYYGEALDDPKVQRLSGNSFKAWVNMLTLASRLGGVLPSVDDIAFALRISVNDAQQYLDELILVGLLDIGADGRIAPHNWAGRQYKSDTSAERTRKYRERLKKRTSDAAVTSQVTPPESESETDTEKIRPEVSAKKVDFGFVKRGREGARSIDRLKGRAEGLGLPVDEMIRRLEATQPAKPEAYFTKLCVTELRRRLPDVPETVLRAAVWEPDAQCFSLVCQAMLEAA